MLVSWDDIESGAEIARVYKVGPDANEALFLDDEIIVVEGQEDSALLPTVFAEAGVTARGTIFGWGSGGGDGNPRRIVALLHGLGFEKVVALLDADKPDEARAIQDAFPTYFAATIPADDIRDKPAKDFAGKSGLLDKHGKGLKTEHLDATREVLRSVSGYFADAPESSIAIDDTN